MHIHLDPLGGLAGDMFIAAAIDAELVTADALEETLETLGLGAPQVLAEPARRKGLTGTHVRFALPEADEETHRHLSTILELLDESGLSPAVRDRAQAMFRRLGTVEAQIHGLSVEEVHFHEVGALDSIFDLVAAAWLIEETDATWSLAPISVGSGTTDIAHGTVPLPVPATAELLQDFELAARSVGAELVTPTGATILATLRAEDRLGARPDGRLRSVGYGAGTRELSELANVVRFTVLAPGTSDPDAETVDEVCRLSCDIDDMTPEALAHVEERLREEGALDVVREAVLMKKGRQGSRLSVLCRPADRERIVEIMLRDTSTFGLRDETVRRVKLARRCQPVDTPFGTVSVKFGFRDGTALKATPEYDDCAARAAEHGVPFREVYQAAQSAGRDAIAANAVDAPEALD